MSSRLEKRRGESFSIFGDLYIPPLPAHLQARPDNERRDELWSLRISYTAHFRQDANSTFTGKIKTKLNSYTRFLMAKPTASSGIQHLSFPEASPMLHIQNRLRYVQGSRQPLIVSSSQNSFKFNPFILPLPPFGHFKIQW